MDDSNSVFEVSYDNYDSVKKSMMPLIDNAIVEFKTIFSQAKKMTQMTNNISQKHDRIDDYKIEALFTTDLCGWNVYSPDKMYEMVQSFADQANAAKRDAARFSEKVMNLQSRMSSTEMANKRLSACVEELEARTLTLLDKLSKEEAARCNLARELKESNEIMLRENRHLEKEVTDARKNINEIQIERQRADVQRRKIESDGALLENRAKRAEVEVTTLKAQLAKISKSANDATAAFLKTQSLADKLKVELDNEIQRNQINRDRIERENKRIFHERDNALEHQKKLFEKEIAELHIGYAEVLQRNKKATQEAIARSAKEASNAIKSQKEYCKLYNELKINLETYKKQYEEKIQNQVLSRIAHGFNDGQVSKLRIQNGSLPDSRTTKFNERALDVLESTSSSSAQVSPIKDTENLNPRRAYQRQLRGTRQVARSYSITGKFPTKRS